MFAENLFSVQTFRLGEFDIVRIHLVYHISPDPHHITGDGRQRQGNCRQNPAPDIGRTEGGKQGRQSKERGSEVPEDEYIGY